jgi:hypothetical protein
MVEEQEGPADHPLRRRTRRAYAVGHLAPSIAPYAFIVAMLVGLIPIARRAVMAALAAHPSRSRC